MTTAQTSCWYCSTSYPMADPACPHCKSTNGNHNLNAAMSESASNPAPSAKQRLNDAAPYLLAALRDILAQADDYAKRNGITGHRSQEYDAVYRQAIAAIARATGSTA